MKLPPFFMLALATFSGVAAQTASSTRASLSGRILDNAGHPLPAKITVFRMTFLNGFAEAEQQCDTAADEQGRFECKRLPSGKYILQVSAAAQKFFYPAAAEIEAGEFISLRVAESGWAEVRAQNLRRFDASGILPEHSAAATFTLKVHVGAWLLNLGTPVSYDGKTGQFKISQLASGHYELTAHWSKDGLRHESEMAFTVEGLPLTHLRMPDDQLVQISGHIADHLGIGEIAQIELQRLDGTHQDVRASIKDDFFQFESVLAGQYVLAIPSNNQVYIAAITSNGKTLPGPSLVIAAGQSPTSVEVQLAQPALSLAGKVKEWASGEERAEVVAQSEESGEIFAAETNERREFRISGLSPGSYRLFTWPGLTSIAFRDPQILKQYRDNATELTVTGGSAVSLAVELSPLAVH